MSIGVEVPCTPDSKFAPRDCGLVADIQDANCSRDILSTRWDDNARRAQALFLCRPESNLRRRVAEIGRKGDLSG